MKYDYHDYTIPVWCVCPIVNRDTSDINEEEEQLLSEFEASLTSKYGDYTIDWPNDIDEAKEFISRNDVDYFAGDCVRVKVYFKVKTTPKDVVNVFWDSLKKDIDNPDRVMLNEGYGSKTKEGLFAVIMRLAKEVQG